MAWTPDDYLRLGDQLRAARRKAGYTNLKQFQEYLDGPDGDGELTGRTYADIEGGKLRARKQFAAESLAYLEDLFGWFPGATRAILDNRKVDLYTGVENEYVGVWAVEQHSSSASPQELLEDDYWAAADARFIELEGRVATLEERVLQIRAPKLPSLEDSNRAHVGTPEFTETLKRVDRSRRLPASEGNSDTQESSNGESKDAG